MKFTVFIKVKMLTICVYVVLIYKTRLSNDEAHLSRVMRKPAFNICENKDTDQLRGNREADKRLCFHYTESTIPLLS